ESRVRMLAEKYPAMYIVFDLLGDDRKRSLLSLPLAERRRRLERFADRYLCSSEHIRLSPATRDPRIAGRWFRAAGGNLDGLIAKHANSAYLSGRRDGMQKVKHHKTVDCVVGSLLLGLYDEAGLLQHVGFTSSFAAAEREKITKLVEPLIKPPGFT